MPMLNNANPTLTEEVWQQFQRDNPGATWAQFRQAFPINAEVVQQAGPNGVSWVAAPPPAQAPAPDLNPLSPNFSGVDYVQQARANDSWYASNYADYLKAQGEATAMRDQLGAGLYDSADNDVWQAARLNTPIVIRNGQAVDVKDYLNQKYGTYDWITFLKNNNVANLPDNPNQQASVYRDYMKTLQGFSPTQAPGLFSTPVATAAPTPAPVPGTSSFQPAASGSGLLNGSNGSSGNAANTAYGMMMYDPQRARSFTTGPAPTVQDSSAWQAQYPSMFR